MPPGIHTITGSPADPRSGDHTLRVKQSSPDATNSGRSMATAGGYGGCGVFGPYVSAARTPLHESGRCGGRSRLAPNGGAAYEMPLNVITPPLTSPRTSPWRVLTTVFIYRVLSATRALLASRALQRFTSDPRPARLADEIVLTRSATHEARRRLFSFVDFRRASRRSSENRRHRQHRAPGPASHRLGDAAQQGTRKARTPVRSQNDQVDRVSACVLHDPRCHETLGARGHERKAGAELEHRGSQRRRGGRRVGDRRHDMQHVQAPSEMPRELGRGPARESGDL